MGCIKCDMTKKHFIALADALRNRQIEQYRRYSQSPLYLMLVEREHNTTIEALADFCTAQNPRFDRQRWLDYVNRPNPL